MIGRLVVAWLSGVLFALGLGISSMTDPNRVIAFLDVTGDWDPALALVMVGAIATYALPAWWIERRGRPLLDGRFYFARFQEIDARLILGAVIFGIGWGIGGYCPGPALVASSVGGVGALWFTAGMVLGMLLYHHVIRPRPQAIGAGKDAAVSGAGSCS